MDAMGYKWISGVITLLLTPLITSRGPPCKASLPVMANSFSIYSMHICMENLQYTHTFGMIFWYMGVNIPYVEHIWAFVVGGSWLGTGCRASMMDPTEGCPAGSDGYVELGSWFTAQFTGLKQPT